jgi:hypothetical protein
VTRPIEPPQATAITLVGAVACDVGRRRLEVEGGDMLERRTALRAELELNDVRGGAAVEPVIR